MGGTLVLPFLLIKLMLPDCPFAHGLLDPFCICKMLVLQILLPSILVYLCAAPVPCENISSLLMSSEKKPAILYLMDLTVSNAQRGWKILTSHLTDLGLKSTSLAPPCKVALDLEFLCSNKGY